MMNKKIITTNQDSHFSIIGLLTLAFIAQGIILGFTVLLPFVQADFILSRGQIGLYSTFLFFSSFIMAIFSGWIVDFFGVKLGLVTGVFILGLFMFLVDFAKNQ